MFDYDDLARYAQAMHDHNPRNARAGALVIHHPAWVGHHTVWVPVNTHSTTGAVNEREAVGGSAPTTNTTQDVLRQEFRQTLSLFFLSFCSLSFFFFFSLSFVCSLFVSLFFLSLFFVLSLSFSSLCFSLFVFRFFFTFVFFSFLFSLFFTDFLFFSKLFFSVRRQLDVRRYRSLVPPDYLALSLCFSTHRRTLGQFEDCSGHVYPARPVNAEIGVIGFASSTPRLAQSHVLVDLHL